MEKNLYIDASHPNETRVVLKSGENIEDYEYEGLKNNLIKNNIYLGKVSRIEPSLQAAFVDFGRERHGFLSFNDIQSDYYQIPTEDKDKLQEVEEKIREDLKNTSASELNNLENSGDLQKSETEINGNSPINNGEVNLNQEKQNENNIGKKYREKLKNTYGLKKYRIQEVIKPGQVILIQVIKEERGQKGAALTTFISLAGKYIVLMPNTAKGGGISRKIFNSSDRNRVKSILNEIEIPNSMGVIVRTAGASKTKNEIEKDFQNTLSTWDQIKNKAVESNAPSLIYEEGDVIKRALRDIYDNETKNVYVDGNEGYQKTKMFMKELIPKNLKFVKKYRGKIPLFHDSGIEKELNNIFEPTVKLKSGGYLVINPTEALVSIDINSGQSIKGTNIEKTALNTNLEAAEEIGRQIKIRDLSGLIVIDFIDMINFYNRRTVERKMRESVRKDRARIQVGRISNFGLLEMTRQRLRESSVKWQNVLSKESFSEKILRLVEQKYFDFLKTKKVNIKTCDAIKIYIENELKNNIKFLEKKYRFKINLVKDNKLLSNEFSISFMNNKNKEVGTFSEINLIEDIDNEVKNSSQNNKSKKPYKNTRTSFKNKRNKIYKKKVA